MVTAAGCASGPLTTREKGTLIGTGLGAASGAVISSTVGHGAAGALIGGPVGLIAGALIGDQLMGQDLRHDDQARTINQNRQEIERLLRENDRLCQQQFEG